MQVTLIIQDDDLAGLKDYVYSTIDQDIPVYPTFCPVFRERVYEKLMDILEEEDDPYASILKDVLEHFSLAPEMIDELEFIGETGTLRITTTI